MKNRILLTLLALIFFTSPAYAALFTDVDNQHNNYVSINHLSEAGIIKGYEDGSFKPDKIVNRVEALKVILTGAGVGISEDLPDFIFTDIVNDQWYAKYVATAKNLGIVSGHPDGSFTPDSKVKRAAFMKMLLETNRFKKDRWSDQQLYNDIPNEDWYSPYMNYAGKAGLIVADSKGNLFPDKELTRAEMTEILYLMKIILHGKDSQYLIHQAELQMAQIELYIGAKNIVAAKRASELAYDFTQQTLKLLPDNNIVLGAAKIAKAYSLLVDAYIAGVQNDTAKAQELAEQTKIKATEAWEANNETQAIAKHIKDRADEILSQL